MGLVCAGHCQRPRLPPQTRYASGPRWLSGNIKKGDRILCVPCYPLRLVWVEVGVVFFLTQTCSLWESLWDEGLDSAEGAEPNPGSRLATQVQPAPSWAPSSPRRSPTDDERNMAVQWSMWLSAGLRDPHPWRFTETCRELFMWGKYKHSF